MKRVLVPLAEGAEEMETVIIVDILRRANCEVCVAGLAGTAPAACSRGMRILPDTGLDAVDPKTFDALVLPGGKGGTERLMNNNRILDIVRDFSASGRLVAAVCAAPLVLQKAGIVDGRKITCHPGVAGQIAKTTRRNDRVVVDGRIVTSQGAGTTLEFALTIVKMLEGQAVADRIAGEIVSQ